MRPRDSDARLKFEDETGEIKGGLDAAESMERWTRSGPNMKKRVKVCEYRIIEMQKGLRRKIYDLDGRMPLRYRIRSF
jgi:hypothetical protein